MITQILFTVLALVVIFIFAINKFSRQIELVAGERLRRILATLTAHPIVGTLTGTAVTSILQSSTATTVMTVGLVNAGLITFYQSLGIIFGANIGTTITSQLIALNVVALAPFVVIAGFLLLKFGGRYNVYGKSVFYFGLVFLCISLITQIVAPLASNPAIVGLFSHIDNLPLAILAGIVLTLVFQSSSVTSGLILVLAGSDLISFTQGVGIMLGANVGTTSTALLIALPMKQEAKRAAIAHALFNVIGLVIILPFLQHVSTLVQSFGGSTTQQIANMHLAFNLIAAITFLIFIKQFAALVSWLAERKIFHLHISQWHKPAA